MARLCYRLGYFRRAWTVDMRQCIWVLLVILIASPLSAEQRVVMPEQHNEAGSELDRSIKAFRDRVARNPGDYVSASILGSMELRRAYQSGDLQPLESARAILRQAIKANPGYPPAKIQLALVYSCLHLYSDALDLAREAALKLPGNPEPLLIMADALYDLGSYEKAREIYKQLALDEPNDPAMIARLARLAALRGDSDGVLFKLELALDRAISNREIPAGEIPYRHLLSDELVKRGRYDEAEGHLASVLQRWPDDYGASARMAELRGAQGRFGESIELYQKLIARTGRPDLMQQLGDLYLFMGRKEEAKPWHDRSLAGYKASLARDEALYLNNIVYLHADSRNEPAKALEWARRDASRRRSHDAKAALAWAHHKGGDNKAAAKELSALVDAGLKDPDLLLQASEIYSAAGDSEKGKQARAELVALNPHHDKFRPRRYRHLFE